jgi:hypothetical protein
MGGDQRQFHLLWLAASSPDQPSTPAAPSGELLPADARADGQTALRILNA